MKNRVPHYYPVMLDLSGRNCVVVGGGQVALRKVNALLDCGALVTVVSPRLCSGLRLLLNEKKISVLDRRFQQGDLKGASLAIAATASPVINKYVAAEGLQLGVLVNVVDDPAHCDFILPAYFRREKVTLAVSTSGASPSLARKIRSRLEKEYGREYGILAEIAEEARSKLKKGKTKVSSSRWRESLDIDLLITTLRHKGKTATRSLLLTRLKQGKTRTKELE